MNFSLSTAELSSTVSENQDERKSSELSSLGAELAFIQNASGEYLSFFWNLAQQCERGVEQGVGQLGSEEKLAPVDLSAYLHHIQRVLDYQLPERFSYPFQYGEQYWLFELVASPILAAHGTATTVLAIGRLVASSTDLNAFEWQGSTQSNAIAPSSDRYQKLLTQITWNIRRTLDLDTIWQQTVTGLGQALSLDRSCIGLYQGLEFPVKVVAESALESVSSLLDRELALSEHPILMQAIATLEPITAMLVDESGQRQSVLVVTTCYQDQPNGLILLYQSAKTEPEVESSETPPHLWTTQEIDLVRELADQVGTAIAHATLFAESQALATELQRVNADFLQKHRELEDARQQAEEASRLKSEFLANTSHELRTPLNGMIGFLKLIMDGMAEDPEEQAEFIDEAYRSAIHLLNLINDILDIAKIEAGKMQLELTPVKLDELFSDVENFTRTQALQKNLSYQIVTPAVRDEIILYANYQRLLQVMLNLVGNAIKFTHEGSITISTEILKKKLKVHNQECPGIVRVRVADTGIGVSLDKQDKLFQSFSQVDGSRTRTYGGTGLGLAISQKLVEAMGGEVNFFSMGEGLGSTVTFTVPLFQLPVLSLSD
ncbi:GAF domain-containing protein [Desertifilum sp. FACHB-1129]|uniref:Circadian input-output histidine kinase CikA n=1 Tax=Desertifilum tharense IPPAS B-1220 TaxID=1781255 RepID=A0A1E5QQ18_9CYAN|nr:MULTISPECIES: ATP-binding protein [Desertifilum]MDA0212583.1 ATP-binding protein [Cyanobacteria bacterium FC1]MBD2314557.1 GAF domain-containing protein [Desertifilum sp. FACHB-1129]MBD2321766.1 GAF domain-containing protein [Desertifilum sp. FACHB-866]MBD2331893.1 GAF domain-containing protein [Desertifilum sp. FACHB-868]OEJ76750.1 histidine kinase [Desertifilum tharense IPPAS B-1220]